MILAGRLALWEETQVMERATLDMQVLAGEPVAPEDLKAALTAEVLPEANLLDLYAERLLFHALDTRDAEAVTIVAGLMDNHPELDAHLSRILNDMLYQQPDAVYAFVRTRLADKPEARWLPLLKLAALSSLQIAINDGTTETIVNWLTLVAREPATYDLGDVLHNGLMAAQPRARQDGELGRQLLILAVKRDPVAADALLEDRELLAVLPNNFGKVLRDLNGDPLQLLQSRGTEMFLVAMARAARACAKWMFSAEVVHQIWEFYINNNQPAVLSPAYRAESIIQEWAKSGVRCLDREALPQLLVLMVRDKRDDLVLQLIHQADGTKTLLPFLANALESSQRNFNEMLDLISRIIVAGDMTPQQAASMYVTMLHDLDWRREALPLAQQLARTLYQHPNLAVSSEFLWHLAALGAETRDEITTKVAAKRLVNDLEAQEDDNQLVEDLRRLCGLVSWNETACMGLTNWWRNFLRAEPLTRLQRLEKALEGKRGLDEERSILQTLIAVRRVIGPQSLHEFAQQVNAAYSVLEALAEAFDTWSKRGITFDQMLVQAELEGRSEDISPQERQILANNLKELAQIIGDMGDNRTKAVLMRRGDDLDRDLMSGEQPPHSAVDAMKWLAGFWAGMQTAKKSGES